jgi:hypothetical protein
MNRMRAANGVRWRLGEAEVSDFAGRDQLLHRSGDVLDRNFGIDARRRSPWLREVRVC